MTDDRYEVVPATEEHAAVLAANMREADKREVWASCRMTPEEAILVSMNGSQYAFAGLADGEVVCIFGIAAPSVFSDRACLWLLTSKQLPRHAKVFLKASKEFVNRLQDEYTLLYNFVDARNTVAIRWLRWLGFEICPAIPVGPDQLPFHPFQMAKM